MKSCQTNLFPYMYYMACMQNNNGGKVNKMFIRAYFAISIKLIHCWYTQSPLCFDWYWGHLGKVCSFVSEVCLPFYFTLIKPVFSHKDAKWKNDREGNVYNWNTHLLESLCSILILIIDIDLRKCMKRLPQSKSFSKIYPWNHKFPKEPYMSAESIKCYSLLSMAKNIQQIKCYS